MLKISFKSSNRFEERRYRLFAESHLVSSLPSLVKPYVSVVYAGFQYSSDSLPVGHTMSSKIQI